MFGIGAPELVLILVLALIFIGPQKLPEMARMFGRSYREFQKALEGVRGEFDQAATELKREAAFPLEERNSIPSALAGKRDTGGRDEGAKRDLG